MSKINTLSTSNNEFVQCPNCTHPHSQEDARCNSCHLPFTNHSGYTEWGTKDNIPPSPPSTITKYIRTLFQDPKLFIKYAKTKLHQLIHPLHGKYSPLAALHKHRLGNYYRRTLSDHRMAVQWGSHYLNRLDLPPRSNVLEHGCGQGRHLALLSQLGFNVYGQDIYAHSWWKNLPNVTPQVVPLQYSKLPWKDDTFNLVLNSLVTDYLTPEQLAAYAKEVHRVLAPGGYWVVLQSNPNGYAADRLLEKFPRAKLHSVDEFLEKSSSAGFSEKALSFEGFTAPFFTFYWDSIRKACSFTTFDVDDNKSWLSKFLPPDRRSSWLLHLQKKDTPR